MQAGEGTAFPLPPGTVATQPSKHVTSSNPPRVSQRCIIRRLPLQPPRDASYMSVRLPYRYINDNPEALWAAAAAAKEVAAMIDADAQARRPTPRRHLSPTVREALPCSLVEGPQS